MPVRFVITLLTCLFVRNFKSIVSVDTVWNESDSDAVPGGSNCARFVLNAIQRNDRVCLAGVINEYEIFVLFCSKLLEF